MNVQQSTIDPNYRCGCPFHGDKYTLKVVDNIINNKIEQFIETGTGYADTIYYMGLNYKIPCISCEVDKERYMKTTEYTKHIENIKIFNNDSTILLNNCNNVDFNKKTLFWLDAHGEFKSENNSLIIVDPVRDELKYIFNNFKNDIVIMIDDFKNIFNTNYFAYDRLGNNELCLDYIKDLIPSEYNIYFPIYTENTSNCCTIGSKAVGWCIITKYILNFKFLKRI